MEQPPYGDAPRQSSTPFVTASDEVEIMRLVSEARRGDREAFGMLFDRHRDYAYAVALRLVRNEQTACDVTQDSFVKALVALDTFRGDARFRTWLGRIVVRTALDQRRRDRRLVALESVAEPIDDRMTALVERGLDLDAAVATLRPPARALIELRYRVGYSYEQIARVLGISAGTVASRLARARQRLARLLGRPVGGQP